MTGKSKELLQKVYDHLDSIDVTKLSMRELQDFLEVVQKGQFLESFGQVSPYAFGFGGANPKMFENKGNDTAAPVGPKGITGPTGAENSAEK